jgi:NTP pyrophosphatase (non-canonical NTP hydrolase)
MSELKHLFVLQAQLMKALGIDAEKYVDIYDDEFMAACIGLASEAMEILDEINIATRPWAGKSVAETRIRVAKEAIDVLFYFIEIMIFLHIDPDKISVLYEEKWRINIKRASTKSKD